VLPLGDAAEALQMRCRATAGEPFPTGESLGGLESADAVSAAPG